jgi:trigger factor
VKEKHLPELNDEFAKSFGAEDITKLREGVRTDLENELKFKQERDARNQLVGGLLGAVQFDLPDSVVQAETRNVVYDLVRENQQRGISRELIEQQKEQIYSFAATSAKDRVKATFLLSKIAEKESLRVDQQEIAQRVYYLAQANNTPVEKFAKQIAEREGYGQIQQELLTSKVLDLLLKEAKIEEVPEGSLKSEGHV